MSFIPRNGQWVKVSPAVKATLADIKSGEMEQVELTVGIARLPLQGPGGEVTEIVPEPGKTWVSFTDMDSGFTLCSFVIPYENMTPIAALDDLPRHRRETSDRWTKEAGRILDKRGQISVRRTDTT